MKLSEKQAFRVMEKILNWATHNDRSPEAEADFVMKELINFDLGER